MAGALDGIRVLDLSRALAGPFASMNLGDMGAEVIKVEDTKGGDTTRGFTPFWNGESTYYLSTNRNKRGIAVNLGTPAGQEIARTLVLRSDVLIESFRAGAMERWNLGWEELHALNPRLIYCAVSAAGRDGPDKDRAGVDLLMQAYGGLMSITGEADGEPVRTGTSVVDLSTGAAALSGILAALYQRERSGMGQRVDVSLLGTTIAWMTYHAVAYFATGKVPGRTGSHHPSVAPYGGYPTKDGYLVVAIAFDSHWAKFCDLVGRPELATDPRFATNPNRVANREELDSFMIEILAERTAEAWAPLMDEAGITSSPINTLDQVLSLPQVIFQEYVSSVPHPHIPDLRMPGIATKFTETPSSIRRHPPKLGEHTEEVLLELGYDQDQITGLRRDGVI
jgi:crotonobetainyl-CoA:carnitine CoA-transferase CaiB-like acyl-CoA transferase